MLLENQPLVDLYAVIDQHKLYIVFIKENDVLSDEKKSDIIAQIEDICYITKKKTARKREVGLY